MQPGRRQRGVAFANDDRAERAAERGKAGGHQPDFPVARGKRQMVARRERDGDANEDDADEADFRPI